MSSGPVSVRPLKKIRSNSPYEVHKALKMGLGHHETKRDIIMHHFIQSASEGNTDSDAENMMIA